MGFVHPNIFLYKSDMVAIKNKTGGEIFETVIHRFFVAKKIAVVKKLLAILPSWWLSKEQFCRSFSVWFDVFCLIFPSWYHLQTLNQNKERTCHLFIFRPRFLGEWFHNFWCFKSRIAFLVKNYKALIVLIICCWDTNTSE